LLLCAPALTDIVILALHHHHHHHQQQQQQQQLCIGRAVIASGAGVDHQFGAAQQFAGGLGSLAGAW
jgi:hypothetical protein